MAFKHRVLKQFVWVPAAALAVTLGAQVLHYRSEPPITIGAASWRFVPQSVEEASAQAHTIVRAQVVKVERGQDLLVPARGEPTGEDRIPTQKVTVKVQEALKGNAAAGSELTLFQTGGDLAAEPPASAGADRGAAPAEQLEAPGAKGGPESTPPAGLHANSNPSRGARRFILEGDPLYKVGEQYVLLLENGPRNQLRTVAPEGRFKVENGVVTPMVTNAATRELSGKPVAALESRIRTAPQRAAPVQQSAGEADEPAAEAEAVAPVAIDADPQDSAAEAGAEVGVEP